MKRLMLMITIVILYSIFSSNIVLADKSYTIPLVTIVAKLQSDGSLTVEENRTYDFDGQFSWADYSLPLRGLGTVSQVNVSEDGADYIQSKEEYPGSFFHETANNSLHIKWYYRAEDQQRTFTISYQLSDVVNAYNDIAEFYYKFAGANRPNRIDSLDVKIVLPQPANKDVVKIWAHGPLHGQIRFEDDVVHSWTSPLPADQFWENRVLLPTAWLSDSVERIPTNALQRILDEERTFAEQANQRRIRQAQTELKQAENDKLAMNVSIAIGALGLLILYFLYQKYGKGHIVRSVGTYSSEVPDNLPPALLNYIYYDGHPTGEALMSTIMDLSRRHYIQLSDTGDKPHSFWSSDSERYKLTLVRSFFESHKQELTHFERDLIEFLFDQIAGGNNELTFKDISKSKSTVMKWFSNWKKFLKSDWGDKRIYEKSSIKGTILNVSSGLVVTGAGIVITIMLSSKYGIIALVAGILLIFFSAIILTYTREVKQIKTEVKSFKNYLTRYHYQQEPALLQSNFEQYLIYGLAVGLSSDKIKKMLSVVDTTDVNFMPWYTSAFSSTSPAQFADSFSSMVSATSGMMSSASGAGGAASGGGGGGAGGASGGAG
ncbi:DUF2207 domain-containing protein [candidate division KSB1 bacterium]|nr:DUF2207 domain-containing protein [candidate division KSB1 bacterium]